MSDCGLNAAQKQVDCLQKAATAWNLAHAAAVNAARDWEAAAKAWLAAYGPKERSDGSRKDAE